MGGSCYNIMLSYTPVVIFLIIENELILCVKELLRNKTSL